MIRQMLVGGPLVHSETETENQPPSKEGNGTAVLLVSILILGIYISGGQEAISPHISCKHAITKATLSWSDTTQSKVGSQGSLKSACKVRSEGFHDSEDISDYIKPRVQIQ
ncbi:uncharacterized protein RAG0_08528 [Rhynchosporium agropyri]|uniref:Uncharacterized protein n=1 Tax=Rhynchosporium agropyri TaxID=914238 RepID=A0A1E1KR85_9HELO|nr:uncharacterized protein RAG0_08528 [Rhynchosporium agropyri]